MRKLLKDNAERRILYHGSEFRIERPFFGGGKAANDYGLGFYCTEEELLAKEWAVTDRHDGFANRYELKMRGLKVLDLTARGMTVLHWLAILLENRVFDMRGDVLAAAHAYLRVNFAVDDAEADVMIGYRADDNYFSFARAFLNGSLSYERLCRVIRLGDLGLQVVVKSRRAFERLKFLDAVPVSREEFLSCRRRREDAARAAYVEIVSQPFDPSALYMTNIIQQGVKPDDPRL